MVRTLLLALACAGAQAVEVRLDLPDQIVPGVVLSGAVEIAAPGGNITAVELPEVPGLTWRLSNRNSMQTVNGATTVSVGIVLRADALGDLELPPVAVRMADGSAASSAPRAIRVTSGDPTLVGEAVASCRFDPPSIVPGQPTSLELRICLLRGELGKLDIAPPEGAISLGERSIAQGRSIDAKGQSWTVYAIAWPITHAVPGSYAVGGQQSYQIQVGDGFFDQRVRRRQVAVAPATLAVEPLPAEGRPEGFTGLIGPLAATAALERPRLAAGEGTVLGVTVRGRQTDLARRPALHLQGAQAYPKDESGGGEARTFRWDIVPAVPGVVAVPALRFPYFDPGSRTYRSADTAPLELTVLPGRSRDLGVVGAVQPAAPARAAAAEAAGLMPAPLRGAGGPRPAAWMAPAAAAAGLALALGIAGLGRALGGRRPHRGRALRAAGSDPAALAAALAGLRPALRTPERLAAADALQDAIDRHRFGGERMPDPTPWVRALEDVP